GDCAIGSEKASQEATGEIRPRVEDDFGHAHSKCRGFGDANVLEPGDKLRGGEEVIGAGVVRLLVRRTLQSKQFTCQVLEPLCYLRLSISNRQNEPASAAFGVIRVDAAIADEVPDELAELLGRALWRCDLRRVEERNAVGGREAIVGIVRIGVLL